MSLFDKILEGAFEEIDTAGADYTDYIGVPLQALDGKSYLQRFDSDTLDHIRDICDAHERGMKIIGTCDGGRPCASYRRAYRRGPYNHIEHCILGVNGCAKDFGCINWKAREVKR